jgi:hypothetical protein
LSNSTNRRASDWLEVNDLAIKHWEQNRLRRCNSALVDGALIAALKNLLRPLHAVNVFNPIADSPRDAIENNATKIAHDYYAGNDQDRRRAREKVEAWGTATTRSLPRRCSCAVTLCCYSTAWTTTAPVPNAHFRRNSIAVPKPAVVGLINPRVKMRGQN